MDIYAHYKYSKPGIAFYSTVHKEDHMKRFVLRETSYELKIFDLKDHELP